jgi:cephalosporin hydroxylase
MKKLANLLVAASVLLVVYVLIIEFKGETIIQWGSVRARTNFVLLFGNFLMLIAVAIKLSTKEEKGVVIRSLSRKGMLFWLSSVLIVIIGSVGGFLWFYADQIVIRRSNQFYSDQEVIRRFNQIYYWTFFWKEIKWLSIPSFQNPCDNWVIQEIISEIKPDFIIETGTAKGGSTLFYATVLEKVNQNGKVITIDVDPQVEEASKLKIFKERVEVIKGSSVSPELIDEIDKKVKNKKVVVILDSLHTKEHVLKELDLYSNFVSLDSYIVVNDTNLNGHPVVPGFGPGPMEAVREFLKNNKDFEIDHDREKFLLTFYPSGYLKRMK